ncbi:hypothetical protein HMPREF0179_05169 [Bilophila wadsworthia 3_1_6]|uniref:Uncharacterized protein n=1 Tax=Bilophila wadsworthia (strain 3_1_6) TaxID=563192 RepID=S2KT49_BILW3|nr:4Fe-4S cluster-binding domain-containing protein [Bilophila wadsworthia]EPC05885.1 hypothetical protein HMPREF0179_05169 [Bilophila wadsworthia 3_1_6]
MLTIIGSEFNPTHNAFEIYVSGCKRHCPGCHNPEAQAFGKGKSARLWMNENRYKFMTGTFSRVWILGGDLMDQAPYEAHEFIRDLRKAMKPGVELWLWTGHEFDEVPLRILGEFDVVKTGAYREDLPGHTVAYDGHDGEPRPLVLASNNQQLHRITAPCPQRDPNSLPMLPNRMKALLSDAFPDSLGSSWKDSTPLSPNVVPA